MAPDSPPPPADFLCGIALGGGVISPVLLLHVLRYSIWSNTIREITPLQFGFQSSEEEVIENKLFCAWRNMDYHLGNKTALGKQVSSCLFLNNSFLNIC